MNTIEVLEEIKTYIQEMREQGDTDLRQILHFIGSKQKEIINYEHTQREANNLQDKGDS